MNLRVQAEQLETTANTLTVAAIREGKSHKKPVWGETAAIH